MARFRADLAAWALRRGLNLSLTLRREGPRATNGTFSRFGYCGGRVVLIEGVDRDLFYLVPAGLETETEEWQRISTR